LRDNNIRSEKKQSYGNVVTQSHGSSFAVSVKKIARLPKIAKPPKDGDAKPGV
jgi:hypothetical protein